MIHALFRKKALSLLLLASYSLAHANALEEYRALHANRNILQRVQRTTTDFVVEFLGNEDVSEETEAFVREVQKELGMMSFFIPVYKMTNLIKPIFGRENAFVFGAYWISGVRMIISEEWFKTLSHEEKRFLIAHELAHAQKYHIEKRIVANKLLNTTFAIGASCLSGLLLKKNLAAKIPTRIAADVTAGLLPVLAFLYYMRSQEKEADLVAAIDLKNGIGGVKLCKTLKAATTDPKSKFVIKRFFAAIVRPFHHVFHKLFSTHPETDERIEYLQKIADEQAAAANATA